MSQVKEKKNPDYTETAEKLCNPIQVKDLLDQLHLEEQTKTDLEKQLKEQCADIVDGIAKMSVVIADTQKQIKEAIEAHGSYQDTEVGVYAVKYRRTSITYDAEKFSEYFPKYVPIVLSTINVDELEKLIKGGSITIEELHNCDVIKEDFKYAFYIR